VNDETHAGSPNWQTIRSNAQSLTQLISELPTWFPVGSGPESGEKTRAKAEIWAKFPDFQEKARLAHAASLDLLSASAGGDVALVASNTHNLGLRCASCHEEFREKQ
jgi:cytochrome c556